MDPFHGRGPENIGRVHFHKKVFVEKVKVIQMGIGIIGQAVTFALYKKSGVKIVGAIDTDKQKVGRDLGAVAALGKNLGIMVTNDAGTLFEETDADVVIHTVCVYMHKASPQIAMPIKQGMNIISAAEALGNPYVGDPGLAAKLDRLAKEEVKGGVWVRGRSPWIWRTTFLSSSERGKAIGTSFSHQGMIIYNIAQKERSM
jgi:hypothetical protein